MSRAIDRPRPKSAAPRRRPCAIALEERLEHLVPKRGTNPRPVVGHINLSRAVIENPQRQFDRFAMLGAVVNEIGHRATESLRAAGERQTVRAGVGNGVTDVGELRADRLQQARQVDEMNRLQRTPFAQIGERLGQHVVSTSRTRIGAWPRSSGMFGVEISSMGRASGAVCPIRASPSADELCFFIAGERGDPRSGTCLNIT